MSRGKSIHIPGLPFPLPAGTQVVKVRPGSNITIGIGEDGINISDLSKEDLDSIYENERKNSVKAYDHLLEARCRLYIQHPWYGSIVTRLNYVKDYTIPTIGVSIHSDGKIMCYYNPQFILELKIVQISAVLIHEVQHILREHIIRGSDLHKHSFNVAADFVINGSEDEPDIKDLPECGCFLPINKDGKINQRYRKYEDTILNGGLDKSSIAEDWYDWLEKVMPEIPGFGDTDFGDTLDDHDTWSRSTASRDQANAVARDLIRGANCAGDAPGEMREVIEKLEEPTFDWSQLLKSYIGRMSGGFKRKTHSRVNRRHDVFGMKGNSRHASSLMTIMIDTSASVSSELFERFFAEIDKISQYFKITLVQFDCNVSSEGKPYKKGDWKHIEIVGRGGTDFTTPLDYIEENGLVGVVNIILSDGEAPCPIEREYDVIWCFYNTDSYIGENFWGQVLRIDPRSL